MVTIQQHELSATIVWAPGAWQEGSNLQPAHMWAHHCVRTIWRPCDSLQPSEAGAGPFAHIASQCCCIGLQSHVGFAEGSWAAMPMQQHQRHSVRLGEGRGCQLDFGVATEAAARPAQVQQLVDALQPSCQVLEAAEKLVQRLAQDRAPDPSRAQALAALLPLEHLLQGGPLVCRA